MEKIKVQISFAGNANLDNVRKQLEELAKNENFVFYTCFLSRRIVEEKALDTKIVDMLSDVLGMRHISVPEDIFGVLDFEEFMKELPSMRTQTADLVDRLYVLDSGTASGVAEEVQLFTNRKVILLP